MTSLLFTVGSAMVNALAFSDTILSSIGSKIMVKKNLKDNDLTLERFKKSRDERNADRMKRLDFLKKRLREKNEARAYINNVDETILEYYRVFTK